MHILMIICQGGWMPIHLSEGWRRLGFNVHEFFYGTHMGKSWTTKGLKENLKLNQNLLVTAKNLKASNKLDLIFAVIYDDVLTVETCQALRKLDVPMVNYHVDLVGQWYRVLKTGKYFDRVACAQRDHWSGLKRAGIKPCYLPMAANPSPSLDISKRKIQFNGVLYLGSPWLYRQEVLAQLIEKDVNVKVYGRNWLRTEADPANSQPLRKNIHDLTHYLLPRLQEEGWQDMKESLSRRLSAFTQPISSTTIPSDYICGTYPQEDFVPLITGASINLGFTHFRGKPGTRQEQRQVRLREFEIPLNGGFYLTQKCQQLQELFPQHHHTISWNQIYDLSEKINYYLEHSQKREKIVHEVQSYCLKHHTWENRFRNLLQELKFCN